MKDKIIEQLKGSQICFQDKQVDQLLVFMDQILDWNEKVNLTAIKDKDEFIIKHFVDSLIFQHFLKTTLEGKLIDVGTGGGFPGVPLKIMNPGLEVTLLDSLNKRINILTTICKALSLDGIYPLHGRAEEVGQLSTHREQYDFAISRAVAPLNVLAEYCLPFVKVGGFFIALKGESIDEELNSSKKAVTLLGGELLEPIEYTIPHTDYKRTLIIIRKLKNTPKNYPRKPGKPSKSPL